MIPENLKDRANWLLATAWDICLHRIISGRISVNKESSLQLQYALVLAQLGELACIQAQDTFRIELETNYKGKNIDIWCDLGGQTIAIELKCFRKESNRPLDIDMYDVLKDISRLESYSHVTHRRFICLTDTKNYMSGKHSGHAGSVSIAHGKIYQQDVPIKPSWVGQWKDKSRDIEITFKRNLQFDWRNRENWYYLYLEV